MIEFRAFQDAIAKEARKKSSLVVIPTGMGKTIIAVLVIAQKLCESQEKILFLSPTKPLVTQHARSLRDVLACDAEIVVFTGEVSPEKRVDQWKSGRIIVSTPQVIENDLIARRISLSDVGLVIYDEAHRAVGNYAYVFIADQYRRERAVRHILGMTASPGSVLQKILEVCRHLEISHIEIRTKQDPDVRPYVHDMTIEWKEISLPTNFSQVLQLLRKALAVRLKVLKEYHVLDTASVSMVNRRQLLDAQHRIQQALRADPSPNPDLYKAASTQNAAIKLYHGIELLQTQGVQSLRNYLDRMGDEARAKGGSKASRSLMTDPVVLYAIASLKLIKSEHPKLDAVTEIVKYQLTHNAQSKIIVFTHYRDTSQFVHDRLTNLSHVHPVRFVGQAGKGVDKGMTQKEQLRILQEFKEGGYNVLIATSVAEEGLDIPSTDLVVFYEPVPSEIRTIQRRGRTARKMPGKVIILITKGTPDEGYYWASRRKERTMRGELEILRSALKKHTATTADVYSSLEPSKNQRKLDEYTEAEATKIIVDHRESRSTVMRYLAHQKVTVEQQQLDVGDYVLSSRIGVERKTVDDFLQSLLDGKLFTQMRNLRDAYSRPLLIVEGEGILTKRNISQNAIFGSMSSIIIDYGIPVITTRTAHETADFLRVIAHREQHKGDKAVVLRGEKTAMSLQEQQRFLVEGLPHVSAVLAQRLLTHFGTIQVLTSATEAELCEVQGIGKNIAADIFRVFREEFQKS
ncbi:MAG: DEAD/DEAH box helicase [Candidatus Thermoplasmatota archaeon]|nr:DEAD/DEAH box helicase [Candidatus Thermoplasmatota archaeon]MBU1941791.1 DEAD/DEAH box helicase [Candidatus Thermoplasmatota archaeon]